MAVTITHIADALGISRTTVSAVLNGNPSSRVASDTREMILQMAKRMGYTRNQHARTLRTGKSQLVSIVAFRERCEIEVALMDTLENMIRELGYMTMIRTIDRTSSEEQAQVLQEIMSSRVEGIISLMGDPWRGLYDRYPSQPESIPLASNLPLPGLSADVVITDREWGSYQAVKHLLELGHRKIAILHGDLSIYYSSTRYRGYSKALEEFGIPTEPSLMLQISNYLTATQDLNAGYACGKSLIEKNTGATAVFCYTDSHAMGLMRAYREAGLRIPEDMAVVGFDNLAVSAFGFVPLTTVAPPVHEMAVKLVEFLFDRIDGRTRSDEPRFASLKPELIIRESTVSNVCIKREGKVLHVLT